MKLLELLRSKFGCSKTWKNHCLQLDLRCFAGWKLSRRSHCLQNTKLKKADKFFDRNMALSDLLFPIFSISKRLLDLHVDSWLIGGLLGQIFCKLPASSCWGILLGVSSEFGSDISWSIWSCRSSTTFATHQSQAVSFLYSGIVDCGDSRGLAKSVFLQTRWKSRRNEVPESVEK